MILFSISCVCFAFKIKRLSTVALFPSPCPAFQCLQYIKAGRAWSHEHDVIDKWQKISERKVKFCVFFQPTTSSTLGTLALLAVLSSGAPTFVLSTTFLPLTSRTVEKIPGPPCSSCNRKWHRPGNKAISIDGHSNKCHACGCGPVFTSLWPNRCGLCT